MTRTNLLNLSKDDKLYDGIDSNVREYLFHTLK